MNRLDLSAEWQTGQGLAVVGVRARPGYGDQAGQQARTDEGVPRWIVTAVTKGGEALDVTVPAPVKPDIARFAPVVFKDLVAGGSTRGLWFAATGVAEVEKKPATHQAPQAGFSGGGTR